MSSEEKTDFCCGLIAPPHQLPGTGPHYAKLVCSGCGVFLTWTTKPGADTASAGASLLTVVRIARAGQLSVAELLTLGEHTLARQQSCRQEAPV